MNKATHIYYHGDEALHAYLAHNEAVDALKPAVLVVHDWSGRNDFACKKADMLASTGYIGFALDMYGQARIGETVEEKQALMQPFLQDRLFLRARIQAALDAVKSLPFVDKQRIAVIGFCFGGLCALDLARSGAEIVGAVSLHGLLNKPQNLLSNPIKAKILALHGYDDPMVTPTDVDAFCQEMTIAEVDWQMHMYGLTKHAFTNPQANDPHMGTVYNASAATRSLQEMHDFLKEVFK